MGWLNAADLDKVNKAAAKSKEFIDSAKKPAVRSKSMNSDIADMSAKVIEYFKDSPARLITSVDELHAYVDKCIEFGYCGIDTETTGLDRVHDTIVGASLYVPTDVEVYIPMKHLVPIFDEPYKDQLTYDQVGQEFQRIADNNVKLIFANADFDLSMIYKDLKVDFNDVCYYDVILAWRCLKENELDNSLKSLYNKYVLGGKGDPMKFKDFFTPQLFPYCKPEVAKLYAANDAKITYELFKWQLPYVTKDHPKCQKHHLEAIADLIWNVEFPLIKVCQTMHRTGIYVDKDTADVLMKRYADRRAHEMDVLAGMIDTILEKSAYSSIGKQPFTAGATFNPNSTVHVKHLLYTVMKLPKGKNGESTDKSVLNELNLPVTNQILKVRSLDVLISTFVEKLPKATTSDSRIHAQFKQIGAATGRFCIAKGTKITVLNGQKNIEDIVPGDLVYCYDDSGTLQLSTVKHLWLTGQNKECVRVKWQSSGTGDVGELICTPDHRILKQPGEWVRADELNQYDKVVHLRKTITSGDHMVLSVQPAGKYDVYDIEVETYHNFIANEICVHNSSAEPNMQNIPSHAIDIRHMFRATPGYVMLSSDYSQQEPKLTAFVSQDTKMIDAFTKGRDIYATIASLAFQLPYEKCLEFHPDTHEYQPDGKARRGEAKTIVLGITYGRSVTTIAEQLFGSDESLSQEVKIEKAQKVYDSVLNAFPQLRTLMLNAQKTARVRGYVETILGRRRHIPDMQLPEFEFKPLPGYVNPDIDPLDVTTLKDTNAVPERVIKQLEAEFKSYKYFGQIVRRTRELSENDHIKVINNRNKITEASRKCVNSIIQGSAADQTKLAILKLESNPEWKSMGGRLLVPVHDELIAEVPIDKWKEGGELLSKMMIEAADFLPFSSKCDVTTTLRWYGLEYPCPYIKPESLHDLSPNEVKWVQYHLCELEYVLPVYLEPNGDKPRGDAALGVNGVVSAEYNQAIEHYKHRYNIQTDEEFIEHIHNKVCKGEI